MDPNVIGMHRRLGGARGSSPNTVAVLRLTAESDGNAVGVGMADLVPATLVSAMDAERSAANVRTSGWLDGIRVPETRATEEELLRHLYADGSGRLLLARDTARLERFLVSPGLVQQAEAAESVRVIEHGCDLVFDPDGRLRTGALPL